MISIVTYGRNDNYSFNLVKRIAAGFNCLAEVLTEEDEILFTDYNTPDHLPTLPEFIWDTLTEKALKLVKVIRISHALHEKLKGDSPLPVLESVSRNAAIVRCDPKSHWILSTNPDVLLVLASKWPNLDELLRTIPDSFYEMPRFDIPESVWSSLRRNEPKNNMTVLRDWLISNKVAVAETSPYWQCQEYLLFDAPGDFQLAPRNYFFRLRGFDESMNKFLHSDSNLCKRMWLLNGCRTDHLLGNLWVLHQDHYLGGEWAGNFVALVQNDLHKKVFHQEDIKANDEKWGLQDVRLPMFCLSEKVTRQRSCFVRPLDSVNDELLLSKEPDWRTQPIYRLGHYDPALLTPYLRESLRVISPESLVAYLGQNRVMLERVQSIWEELSGEGARVYDLAELAERNESVDADVLIVDLYYERPEYWGKRIRLVQEQMQRRIGRGQVGKREAAEEASEFCNRTDSEAWLTGLLPLWGKLLPHVRLHRGAGAILLGCNPYVGMPEFKEAWETYSAWKDGLSPQQLGQETSMPKKDSPGDRLEFRPLYVHHRIVVLRAT